MEDLRKHELCHNLALYPNILVHSRQVWKLGIGLLDVPELRNETRKMVKFVVYDGSSRYEIMAYVSAAQTFWHRDPMFRTTIYRGPHSFTGQKKVVPKRKKCFYLLLNIILQKTRYIFHNEACVIGALVSGYC
jgi:hypothetical protein